MPAADRRLIDLSHTVAHGLVTYRGLPAPVISDHLSRDASRSHYAPGTTFQIGRIDMVANTGTYIDAPFHRYADGQDLAQLALAALAGRDGLVFRAPPGSRAIGPGLFAKADVKARAVLINTGWDRHWGREAYFENHPYLTRAAAAHLRQAGAALVGIDSLNIDDTEDGERPAHTLLLGAEIPIVEHLCHLEALPDQGFSFFAVPVKVKGMGSFPVRAFAMV